MNKEQLFDSLGEIDDSLLDINILDYKPIENKMTGISKKKVIMVCVLLAAVVLSLSICVLGAYSARTTKGFYSSATVSGVAVTGTNLLGTYGYGVYPVTCDGTASAFISALTSYEVVILKSHAAPGLVTLSPTSTLYPYMLVSSGINAKSKLVYLSGCENAKTASNGDNICQAIINRGAGTVVGFTAVTSASTTTNGIHQFNQLVFTYLTNGWNISAAVSTAKANMVSSGQSSCGSGSCTIFGNTSYCLS